MAIDPNMMYFPFIKLFLARYQPHSVREKEKDVCLSPIVVAKMTQLVPPRQTTVRFKKDNQNSKFTINVEGIIYNPDTAKYGNYNYVKISFLDSEIAQPIYGVINDGDNEKKLRDEGVSFKIQKKNIVAGNKYVIEEEFRLNKKYKTAPFQIIIEEYERGPNRIPDLPSNYRSRAQQNEQTDRLIYADVIKINAVGGKKKN